MNEYPSHGSYQAASTTSHGRKRATSRANTGVYRSVLDFETEEQLRTALLTSQSDAAFSDHMAAMIAALDDGQPVQKVARTSEDRIELHKELGWVLPYFDPTTTNDEYVDSEVKRLQMVKSYLLDDNEGDEAFDRITNLTKKIFAVPVAMINLIDLGRQWHISQCGINDQEFHRKDSLCATTMLTKTNFIVVPDLTQDQRFCHLDFVTNPPQARFYAAAALISPEGYKVGTLCIIDTVARPHGLTADQTNTLLDLADMTLKVLLDRHAKMEKEREEDPVQVLVNAVHDLVAPLSGIQLSLSLLKDDERVKSMLGDQPIELLNTAVSSAELLRRICLDALDVFHRKTAKTNGKSTHTPSNPLLGGTETLESIPTTRLDELVKNLRMSVGPLPKKIPCIITLDQAAPDAIVADDLKLFRSALNLLTSAVDRTQTGTVHLSIGVDASSHLLFECEDTGEDIPTEAYKDLFHPPSQDETHDHHVGLSSIASLISSMDGEYGFRPRGFDREGNLLTDLNGRRRSGSIFWFSVPLHPFRTFVPTSRNPVERDYSSLPMPEFSQTNRIVQPTMSHSSFNSAPLGMLFQVGMSLQSQQRSACSTGNCIDAIANLAARRATVRTSDDVVEIIEQLGDLEPYPIEGLATDLNGDNSTRARRRRILIIDHSSVIRNNLAGLVNSLGYDAIQSADGMQALKEMQQSLFDVVFCDFTIPIMDGLTCTSRFREWETVNRPWDRQLIVGISEHAELNDRGQGLQAGMDMFYPKPITAKIVLGIQTNNDVTLRMKQLDQWEASLWKTNSTQAESTGRNMIQKMGNTSVYELSPCPPPPTSTNAIGNQGTVALTPVCLIAGCVRSMQPEPFQQLLESKGWKVIRSNDGFDCLKLLQASIWDAILIDDDIPQLAGMSCIASFRQWESKKRPLRQKNLFLVCDGNVPSPWDKNSLIQLPIGCNGVLRRPVPIVDFEYLLQANVENDAIGSR